MQDTNKNREEFKQEILGELKGFISDYAYKELSDALDEATSKYEFTKTDSIT